MVVGVVLRITCSTRVQGSAVLNTSLASSLISLLFWQRNGHVHLVNEETLISRVICCQDFRASVCPSACVPHWWTTQTLRPIILALGKLKWGTNHLGAAVGTVKCLILVCQKELLSLCFCPWSNFRIKSKTRWHLPRAAPLFSCKHLVYWYTELGFNFHSCVSARHLVFVVQPLKENDTLGVSPRPSRATTSLEHQTMLLLCIYTASNKC